MGRVTPFLEAACFLSMEVCVRRWSANDGIRAHSL